MPAHSEPLEPSGRNPGAVSRRQFLRAAALAAAAATLPQRARAAVAPPLAIVGSSDSFRFMGPSAQAHFAQVAGWTGMAACVGENSDIEPAHVRDDLPEFYNALQRQGLDVPLVISDANSLRQPSTEGVLRQTAKLGIKHVRLGSWKLDPRRSLKQQKDDFVLDLRDLGQMCKEIDLHPGFENARDPAYFGTDVRDLLDVIQASGQDVGIYFNPVTALMVQGGIHDQAALAAPHLLGVFAEDFTLGNPPKSCPLGNGIAQPSYFRELRPSGFSGVVVQRFNYPLGNNQSILAHARADLATVQQWLGQYVASPFL